MVKCNIWSLYCIYPLKISVYLVSKALVHVLFSNFWKFKGKLKIAECLFTNMFHIMLNLIEQSLITPMPRPWIEDGHSWFCRVCSQDFLMSNSVCNNTFDKQIRQLLPINKNMTICEETRHRLYLFIKTTTTTDTTTCAHDTFCPLPQAWHVNCPFNCPITLSNYKHGAYTVLLVLKSGWW